MHRLAACTHAPPVKRGDLAGASEYDVFVIIDGEFGQNLSVTPKEILAVLANGKTVIGASSMGALRASELDRSGMIGVGWVYEYFRRSAVRRDSDVALVYSPFDFKPITVPMVDLEYWMEQISAAGLIANRERARLLKLAGSIFFADRTPDRLMAALRGAIGGEMLELSAGIFRRSDTKCEVCRRGGSGSPWRFDGGTPPARSGIGDIGINGIAGQQIGSRHQTRAERQFDANCSAGRCWIRHLCDRLFADPEAIGREFDLPPAEIEAIKQLDRQKFEAAIARLRWG